MSEANLDAKYIQMTQTPVESLICRLAVPTIISNLITTFYNMADTFFIGKISTSASGAVGICRDGCYTGSRIFLWPGLGE